MKATVYILLFLFGVVVIAALAAPYVLDVDKHKPRLASIIEEKTGYGIKLNGKASATFLPSFSLTLNDAEIYETPDYVEKIAAVKNVNLNMNLFNAIGGKVTIDALTLESPQLWIKKRADGIHNFEKPANAPKNETEESSTAFLGIERIVILDGQGEYVADGKKFALQGVNLEAGYRPDKNNNNLDLRIGSVKGDGVAEKDLRLAANYGYADDMLRLSDLILEARGHAFTGEGAVSVGKKVTSGNLTLKGGNVDLVTLLKLPAAQQASGKQAPQTAKNTGWSDEPLHLTQLRDMDLAISVSADSVNYHDAKVSPFNARLDVKPDGAMFVSARKLRFAKGDVDLDVTVKPTGKTTDAVDLKLNIQDLSSAALPAALIAKGAPASGIANVAANLHMRGASVKDFMGSLSGNANLAVRDGKMRSNRLFDAIAKGRATLEGKQPEQRAEYIVLKKFSSDFAGNKGLFSTQNLRAETDVVNIDGTGDLDLYNTRIDMTFQALPTASGDARDVLSAIPVRVVGSFSNPQIAIDIQTGVKRILQDPAKFKDAVKGLKKGFEGDIDGIKDTLERTFRKPGGDDKSNDGGVGSFLKNLGR